ncbi:MAG: sugar phosphate nucleotidyltransferase [Bacteroidales bacterium]|nr:sugar phosphate nucleotidyltransferase [Bacteroidales bacterium]
MNEQKKVRPTLMILAAGMGSRYGGLKQVDKLGPSGETIIDYSVFDAMRAGFGKVVLVIRKSIEKDFLETYGDGFLAKVPYEIVYQELDMLPDGFALPAERTKPWGTAHAIWVAREVVNEPFVVINADDFYGLEAYQTLADFIENQSDDIHQYAMCSYKLENTLSEHGTVSRGVCLVNEDGMLDTVDEQVKIGYDDAGNILSEISGKTISLPPDTMVSMNIWAFNPSIFKFIEEYLGAFLTHDATNPKAELFTPRLVDMLIHERKAKVRVLSSSARWFGVTYAEDKLAVMENLCQLVDQKKYPTPLW